MVITYHSSKLNFLSNFTGFIKFLLALFCFFVVVKTNNRTQLHGIVGIGKECNGLIKETVLVMKRI